MKRAIIVLLALASSAALLAAPVAAQDDPCLSAADGDPCKTSKCSTGGTCSAGTCTGEGVKDCSIADGLCVVGICDADSGDCVPTVAADGDACQTSKCSTGGTCSAGTCTGEGVKECSIADGLCAVGTCDAASGDCVSVNVEAGTACDDGDACTLDDKCDAEGTCQPGTPKTCDEADQCNRGTCSAGTCSYEPLSGQPCNLDDSVCTVDTCGAANAANRSACLATGAALTLVPRAHEEGDDGALKAEANCAVADITADKLVEASVTSDAFAEVSSVTYSLNPSAPYLLGTTPVLVTGTVEVSRAGLSGTCSAEVEVPVIVEDEIGGGDHIRCGFAGTDKGSNAVVMISQPGATGWSGSFTAYYQDKDGAQRNVTGAGCVVGVDTTKSTVSCKKCEVALDKDCPATVTAITSGATVIITNAAAGNRISWTVQAVAQDGTIKSRKCGVCVAAYTNKLPAKCSVEWTVDKPVKCGKSLRRLF